MTRKTMRSLLILSVATGVLATGLAGCSKEEPAPQPVVQKTVPKEKAKAAEIAKATETPASKAAVVFYNPVGKRDPFVPFLKVEPLSARAHDSLPPLERYDIGELKFVGVIWGAKGVVALVEDGEGKGYSVAAGTKIGRGGGVVIRVTEGEILVKEEFRDYSGTKSVRESSIKLQNAGGK
jgi:type IV pilus assembly protein PilP